MKNIFITGIGKGIGKALAQTFLSNGHAVFGTALSSELDYSHDNLSVFPLDLRSEESIHMCAQSLAGTGKQMDVVINNAGVLLDEDETTVVMNKLRDTLEVNLLGTIALTERMIPSVQEDGHIIFISSSAGSLAGVGTESHFIGHYPSYKISKTAINMYTRTLALRLTGRATVSSVHPGWVKTDMGGEEASVTPEEASKHIYDLAMSRPETGQFWFNGEKYPW